jgi:hypothetical protein
MMGDSVNLAARFQIGAKAYAPTTPSLAGRCREFIETGGPELWNGADLMKTK